MDEHEKRYQAKLALDWLLKNLPDGLLLDELKRHLGGLNRKGGEVIQQAFGMAVQSGYEHAERAPAPLKDVGRGDP